jgi:hypothetical protein
MSVKKTNKIRQLALIIWILFLIWVSVYALLSDLTSRSVQAAGPDSSSTTRQLANIPPQQQGACYCSSDIYECYNFETKEEAQSCLDYCKSVGRGDVHGLDIDNDNLACESLPSNPLTLINPAATPYSDPQLNDPVFRSLTQANNQINNGNFESGGYVVGELGFEPPEIGFIPTDWQWYKGQAYGKYNIYLNDSFGIVCPDDFRLFSNSDFALSMHMQSSDQPDARLGVYQTVNVVPGQSYLFVISGTIQAQPGASSPDINNRVAVFFDQAGHTDWHSIPREDWISLPWKEQELEFKLSGPDDPDLAKVENYFTVVKANSSKMTVFIEAWRRWPNWRTTIFTVDCVSLAPLNQVDVNAVLPVLSRFSTSAVDAALRGSSGSSASAAPAAIPATGQSLPIQPALAIEAPAVPAAGGILDTKSNWLLITLASILVISGLVGAGVWNARRHKD